MTTTLTLRALPTPRHIRVLAAVITVLFGLGVLATGVVPPPAVVISAPFAYLLARTPILRRLAVRNASRRPRETVLIILGALLGTAIITSSFVVGDTLTSSIHQSAYTQLGPVDEVILSDGPQAGRAVAAAVERAPISGTDGALSLLTLQAAVSSASPAPGATAGAPTGATAEPQAQIIETNFAQARAFGDDPRATGINGPTPTGDNAAIGRDLAQELDLRVGDPVTIFAYGTTRTVPIDRVLPRLGVAGLASFTNLGGSTSPNLFVAPGTLAAMQLSGPDGSRSPPPISVLAVSNTGDVTRGVRRFTD